MGSSRMNMTRIAILVCVCFLFLTCEVRGRHTKVPDRKNQLQSIKENTIKTIKTTTGDVFDCVDIYKQPGLAHPKLKDHVIQMMPMMFLNEEEEPHNVSRGAAAEVEKEEEEEECPQGSVPIQRLELNNMVEEHVPNEVQPWEPKTLPIPIKTTRGPYKKFWAVTRTVKYTEKGKYFCCYVSMMAYGAGATFNVYGVPDAGPLDVSSSLMWLINEDVGVVLRGGWQVRPARYNDTKTRLFMEWSTDNDTTTCMDTDCPGFVLVSNKPKLGLSIWPVSEYLGRQYAIRVFIYKDVKTGDWWFAMGDKKSVVGYWPKDVFAEEVRLVRRVDYGGFVACPSNKKCPPMGNGIVPGGLNGGKVDNACFIKDVHYHDVHSRTVNLTKKFSRRRVSDYACCDVGTYYENSHGFTFGGPAF